MGIGDVGNVVLRDRKVLSKEGVVIAVIHFDRNKAMVTDMPEIISRGFVFEEKFGRVLDESAREMYKSFQERKANNPIVVRNIAIDFLEKYFFQKTGRRPMVLPVVVEL